MQIDGVPEIGDEVIGYILRTFSSTVRNSLDKASDIQAMHRDPSKRERGLRPIVVQFLDRQTRD